MVAKSAGVTAWMVSWQAPVAALQVAGPKQSAFVWHWTQVPAVVLHCAGALPSADAEFLAAIAFLRRRRLGPFRPPAQDAADPVDPMRELATLGRAGFPRDIAERALRLDPAEAAELLAELKRG